VYDRRGISAVAMEVGDGRAGGGRGSALQRGELGGPGVDRGRSVVAKVWLRRRRRALLYRRPQYSCH